MALLQPEYYSVTYGAGGSTRHQTKDVVLDLIGRGFEVAPHLSFGADSEDAIAALVDEYVAAGVTRIVALRGDMPSGVGQVRPVYANQLVEFLRARYGDGLTLAVACYPEVHPQAVSLDSDIFYLKQKLDAGANLAITQYFYNLEAFVYFRSRCDAAGIRQPIYPGIMPITNLDNLARFSDNCGADIPRWLRKGLAACDSPEKLRQLGEDVVVRLCDQLMQAGVPGFHFYSMNQSTATMRICQRLSLGAHGA